MHHDLRKKLHRQKNVALAKTVATFFKTGPGQYGEGDRFLGIKVPVVRGLIQEERERIDALPLKSIEEFLKSPWHEERLLGVLILVRRYERGDELQKEKVLKCYLKMAKKGYINNWDLVDQSAPSIAGDWFLKRDRALLDQWIDSKSLWERRIAVVATYTMIRNHDFEKVLEYSKRLLGDRHDLMHKACGWMLREVGKKDENILRKFLDQNALKMPRTMLRYAIERLPEKDRKRYLIKKIHH